MRLLRIAGILCASALMLASPASIASPVFDKDTEFITGVDFEKQLDFAITTAELVAASPAFRGQDFDRMRVGVAVNQNTSHSIDLLEHAAALPPFDPG